MEAEGSAAGDTQPGQERENLGLTWSRPFVLQERKPRKPRKLKEATVLGPSYCQAGTRTSPLPPVPQPQVRIHGESRADGESHLQGREPRQGQEEHSRGLSSLGTRVISVG